jgi:3-oxoadipate enol-lactonase
MQVRVGDIQVNYELAGDAAAPVLMLSHSLGASLEMWEPQIDALAGRFRVLRYDTRGHGKTDVTKGPYTLQMLAQDAVGLMDALGVDQAHWIGLSMGGMIGQYLVLDHAERFRSLALCDTAAVIPGEAQPLWDERIEAARTSGLEALVAGTMERWFTKPILGKNPPEVQRIRKQFLATPVEGFIGCAEAIRKLNLLDRLAEIKLPTLIVVGEQDPGTPVAAAKAMHERIPNSRLTVVPGAAHLSNVEQSATFNRTLSVFLGSL